MSIASNSTVIILGSTGSIGTQGLDVISRHPERFTVTGLAAGGAHIELLAQQAAQFHVSEAAVFDETKVPALQAALAQAGAQGVRVTGGPDSVIAMAGTKVLVSPVSMMMIHNPATVAFGDTAEMEKAISMLSEVKESIINAYEIKTGLSRAKLSHLMDAETWMDAHSAVELGFADDILKRSSEDAKEEEDLAVAGAPMMFSRAAVTNSLMDKLAAKCRIQKQPEGTGRSVDSLMERLNLIKQHL